MRQGILSPPRRYTRPDWALKGCSAPLLDWQTHWHEPNAEVAQLAIILFIYIIRGNPYRYNFYFVEVSRGFRRPARDTKARHCSQENTEGNDEPLVTSRDEGNMSALYIYVYVGAVNIYLLGRIVRRLHIGCQAIGIKYIKRWRFVRLVHRCTATQNAILPAQCLPNFLSLSCRRFGTAALEMSLELSSRLLLLVWKYLREKPLSYITWTWWRKCHNCQFCACRVSP